MDVVTVFFNARSSEPLGNIIGGRIADRTRSRARVFAIGSALTAVVALPLLAWHPGLAVSVALRNWLGLLLGAVVTGVFYALGGLGMGDVKLCAAIGAWVGPGQMMMALVAIALAGGVLALAWALATGTLASSLDSTGSLLAGFAVKGLRRDPEIGAAGAGDSDRCFAIRPGEKDGRAS